MTQSCLPIVCLVAVVSKLINTLSVRRQQAVRYIVFLAVISGAYLQVGFVTESVTATTIRTRTLNDVVS